MVVTPTDTPSGLHLEVPPEPTARRAELRDALLAGAQWTEVFGEDLGIGGELWEVWGPSLEAAGMSRQAFSATVAGYRREVWFWLLGDRVWEQVASGLAGRVARRLPAS